MANGDIRGLDISSTVPTQSSRYQAPQVQAPNISSGYGELAGAYDYATKAVLKGFQALGSIAEDHLELERSNRWTETQRAINNLFQKKNFESGDFLASQGQSDLSWNDEHGEVPALRTIKNYIDDSIQQGNEVVSLESILETVKDDSKLHNGAIALIDNRRFALTTKMHTDITKMQVERGKNSIKSLASEVDQHIYDQVIIATNDESDFNITTNNLSQNHIDPWVTSTNSFLKLSNTDPLPYVAKANKFWPKVAKTRFKEVFARLKVETPEKVLELWDSGHFDVEGHIYTLDETGQIVKGPKVKIPVPKHELAQEIRFLTSTRLNTTDKKKKELQIELLKGWASQYPEKTHKMLTTKDGIKQFDTTNTTFGLYFNVLKDPKYQKELISIASSTVKNYEALQSDTSKKDFTESHLNRAISERVDNAMGLDTVSIWDSVNRPKDNSKLGKRLLETEKEIDSIVEDIIPIENFDKTKTSTLIESQGIVKNLIMNSKHPEVRNALNQYAQNLNLALSGARTKTPDLYALDVAGGSPTEPMTLESWENYREVSKNQTNNSNPLLPQSLKETYSEQLKPKRDGGKLDYQADGVDVLSELRSQVKTWAGPEADTVWNDFLQHLSNQGGVHSRIAEAYGFWDSWDNLTRTKYILGENVDTKDDKSSSRRKLFNKWDASRDTYMDMLESPNQKNAHRDLILKSLNTIDPDASDDVVFQALDNAHKQHSKGLVFSRLKAGNVVGVPDHVMSEFFQYNQNKKEGLQYMSNAIIANLLGDTKEGKSHFDELFPETSDKRFRELNFKGTSIFKFANTPQAKEWVTHALIYGQLGNLSLSVTTTEKGLMPTLFFKDPNSKNTGGVTIYEWKNLLASWNTIKKQWAISEPGVQFLERLEGITGAEDAVIKIGDNPEDWINIPFNVGEYTYKEFVDLYEETKKIPKNKLKPSIQGVWPNHFYEPGSAELGTMELIMGDMQSHLRNKGDLNEEGMNKLFRKRIDFWKRRWNAWGTRLEKATKGLATKRARLNDDGIIQFLTPEENKVYKEGGAFGIYDQATIEALRNR